MTAPNRSTGLRTSGPIASLLMPVLLERFLTSAPFSTASSRTRTTRNSSSISSRTTVCVPSFSSDLIARFRLPLADHGLILPCSFIYIIQSYSQPPDTPALTLPILLQANPSLPGPTSKLISNPPTHQHALTRPA
jgi:hypothetical protein